MNDFTGPLVKVGAITPEFNLLSAAILGLLFGFILDRAGFTDAKKIAGTFYFKSVDVPFVMFTAIITAMLGLWGMIAFEWIRPSMFYFLPTYVIPMVVGGFMMGIGMIVSGYCPGTVTAAASIGRIDAIVVLIGIVIGDLLFGNLFPLLQDFYLSPKLVDGRIDQLFGVQIETALLMVFVFALILIPILRMIKWKVWGTSEKLTTLDKRLVVVGMLLLAIISGVTAQHRVDKENEPFIIQIPGWNRG